MLKKAQDYKELKYQTLTKKEKARCYLKLERLKQMTYRLKNLTKPQLEEALKVLYKTWQKQDLTILLEAPKDLQHLHPQDWMLANEILLELEEEKENNRIH